MQAVEVNELTKFWGETRAVDGISFQVENGEVFGFLGPNGAGKTTTIKMLVGLTIPTSGSAKVAGYDVVSEPTEVKKRIGVVPEASNLYNELTVYENLKFVSKLYHIHSRLREKRIVELLETFNLTEYIKRPFGKLSKGLKRRTVLVASLLHEPEILFLDEPTSGLDIMSARTLREVISGLAEEGVTIFLTTHYIEEAGQLCDRIALLVKGNIVEIESPDALRGRVQDIPLLNIKIKSDGLLQLKDLKEVPAEDIRVISDRISILTHDVHASLIAFTKLAEEKGITIEDIHTVNRIIPRIYETRERGKTMRIEEEIKGILAIIEKDLKAYYFKPPNISWGILFPVVLALSFSLRNPEGLVDLAPGLIAMAALFGTTSMEAIVITFEKRVGALERLLLAPMSLTSVLLSKILGGTIFGLVISTVMSLLTTLFLGANITNILGFSIIIVLTTIVHSALGALVAVSVKEVFEAQTLSNYFRFPMIFLCGIFLPLERMPLILQYIARLLPLTYSVEALQITMTETSSGLLLNTLILAGYCILLIILSVNLFRKNIE